MMSKELCICRAAQKSSVYTQSPSEAYLAVRSSSIAALPTPPTDRRKHDPETEERLRTGFSKPMPHGRFRSIGLGLITGASDDDPAAIGTYAAAGASLGSSILWTVPVLFPM